MNYYNPSVVVDNLYESSINNIRVQDNKIKKNS